MWWDIFGKAQGVIGNFWNHHSKTFNLFHFFVLNNLINLNHCPLLIIDESWAKWKKHLMLFDVHKKFAQSSFPIRLTHCKTLAKRNETVFPADDVRIKRKLMVIQLETRIEWSRPKKCTKVWLMNTNGIKNASYNKCIETFKKLPSQIPLLLSDSHKHNTQMFKKTIHTHLHTKKISQITLSLHKFSTSGHQVFFLIVLSNFCAWNNSRKLCI